MRDRFHWARLPSFVTDLVNQELLLRNEYLAAENQILRAHLPLRLCLSDPERSMLAEIGKRLGRRALAQVASAGQPRYHSGFVSQTDCLQVRWFQIPWLSRPPRIKLE